ncbi:MAG: hypothetical protein L0228_03780 [Planctomycetes bacterium]|nr:hypothetical protein [Planctomycetota bacterium]
MSGTNHRTWQHYHVGHFLITVQLDPVADGRTLERHKELANVSSQLIDLMDAHRLPATWAVSDPAHSAATSRILRSGVGHEFAILGDSNWLGPAAGRTRFARELTRRVAQARSAGLSVQTLVPRQSAVEHIDLIVKQQITAIAGVDCQAHASRPVAMPGALHYGVWELPIVGRMPVQSRWFSHGGWSMWRRIRRAARDAATFHLLVDAPAVCDDGHGTQKTIAWLMRRVANWRDRGLVQVETLRAAATRLADVPAVKPQQSILRHAA